MKKRILIADDEYTIRELIEMTLESDYEVIKAEDGLEALKMAQSKPDLIILDIMMPKLDGFEVCKRLKSDRETRGIPIIMLTAKHQIEDVNNAESCGVDEYITKPFEPDFLKKRIDVNFKQVDENLPAEKKLFRYGKSLHYIKGRQNVPN